MSPQRSSVTAAGTVPVHQRIKVAFDGHVIGEGFNTQMNDRVGTALTADIGEDPSADGQSAHMFYQIVTSQEDLEQALSVNAQIDAGFLGISGGAKFDFAKQEAINRSSTYVLASAIVTNALRIGKNFRTNAAANAVIATGGQDDFKTSFGDRYCQALRTGGEIHALMSITSSSTRYQADIAASLHAELADLPLPISGDFNTAFHTATQDATAHTEVNVDFYQIAGQGDEIQMPEFKPGKVRDLLNGFPAIVHSHPVAFEAELLTYDTLALPFVSDLELEDKKRVLQDCLERKQRYWSALSELALWRTPHAADIFENVPTTGEIGSLEGKFERVLNALIAHAEGVSAGAIRPPSLFVPDEEPELPHVRRKNVVDFGDWWTRRDDPTLVADEKTLIWSIARAAAHLMSVPLESSPASLEAVGAVASAAAVGAAAAELRKLDLTSPERWGGPLTSVERLSSMLSGALQELYLSGNNLSSLDGIETLARLEEVGARGNQISNIDALAGMAGLKVVVLSTNQLDDITPLTAMTKLRDLRIAGNLIEDLTPLQGLTGLRTLLLGTRGIDRNGARPGVLQLNPVRDARALAHLPLIANPFVAGDTVTLKFISVPAISGAADPSFVRGLAAGEHVSEFVDGSAVRVGHSAAFDFHPANGAAPETITFLGVLNVPLAVPTAFLAVLLNERQQVIIMLVDPETSRKTADLSACARAVYGDGPVPYTIAGLSLAGFPADCIGEAGLP